MDHRVGGKSAEEVFSDEGLTKLARAACHGDVGEIRRLVQSGVNPNGQGLEGTSPLMWALSCDNLRGMEALLQARADPNLRTGTISPTFAAATRHDPKVLKLLLRYGGDPNSKELGGRRTALIEALSLGINGYGWDNYYSLLDAGADINLADEDGETIALAAVDFGQFEKVEELLERGYSHDLPRLAKVLRIRQVDESQEPWRRKIEAKLRDRGVALPSEK